MTEHHIKPPAVDLIVFRQADLQVLLQASGEEWVLPVLPLPQRPWPADVQALSESMKQLFGLPRPWPVVRCVAMQETPPFSALCFFVECPDPAWQPTAPDLQWVASSQLEHLPFAREEQRASIEHVLHEVETGYVPPLRTPWERLGWLSEASSWIVEQLAQHNYQVREIEQVKHWCISCVLRIHTMSETLYFKATLLPSHTNGYATNPLLFSNEAALVSFLASHFPEHAPVPIAVDEQRGWLLMRDFGHALSNQKKDLDRFTRVVSVLGQMQTALNHQVPQLLALGCKDRRLGTLLDEFATLLADEAVLADLQEEECARVRASVPVLHELVTRLERYNIPASLVHGDLHPGNIGIHQERVVFFDWTDGCVSHPFIDALMMTAGQYLFPDIADARSQLREAYLAAWSAYETPERLEEALTLSQPITMLLLTISFQRLFNNCEPLWQPFWREGVAAWLRDMLESLSECQLS
ncbi:phosphotransferase family protein [Tengunoibacter tsumagoiensis]|uniref:Aminoglycoside phosphotransferase domain-containing protein n=1 Tax=Tengunoibacter tsumagoiensis TaxID=2014871 RepID=A0A402A7I6_9CHLR|nr:aminoglycoside phosphotransferase family protein [Tengunoibacter tsumagoiensis]GCE15015.1 hypothetical protein KTT_48740 [Tengunoibacter tsumagoiensis]